MKYVEKIDHCRIDPVLFDSRFFPEGERGYIARADNEIGLDGKTGCTLYNGDIVYDFSCPDIADFLSVIAFRNVFRAVLGCCF